MGRTEDVESRPAGGAGVDWAHSKIGRTGELIEGKRAISGIGRQSLVLRRCGDSDADGCSEATHIRRATRGDGRRGRA